MKGNISERPMLISSILEYAAQYHPNQEIVSRSLEGPIHRYTYKDALFRTKKLAEALQELGV
jgi:acyl-CoA synthetase (AMP-forming)/AMP-acid ligase II